MPNRQEEMLAAGKARDQLAAQLQGNPGVSLIDIGLDPKLAGAGQGVGQPDLQAPLVLRVHLKTEAARQSTPVPEQINGIPVRTLVADYRLESRKPAI